MPEPVQIHFPPFRLDTRNEQLWRDDAVLPLRPKPFAVLRYLVEHPGRLVTREELQEAVWPGTYVSEGLLRGYVRDLREVLDDHADAPRFIETIPRRGYRFIAPLSATQLVVSSQNAGASSPSSEGSQQNAESSLPHLPLLPTANHLPPSDFVGRDAELAQLHRHLEKASNGQRQLVFVTGEPGIGKTTLIDAFLSGIGSQATGNGQRGASSSSSQVSSLKTLASALIGRGQCVQHYGAGEAYLPVLEALGRLCRQPGGEHLVEVLKRYAPTWLVQLPSFTTDAEFDALQRKVQGTTRERMLREMAEALEVVTATVPLILVLEDLHWSDYSTLDLLGALARRREPVRLLILASYRPAEIIVGAHPLRAVKQELQAHRLCEELPLPFLTMHAVQQYLTQRLPGPTLPVEVARILHQNTDGNPLFMSNVIDYWIDQGILLQSDGQWRLTTALEDVAVGVPESLRQMIEQQLTGCSPEEHRVLEVAGVIGEEFLAATVAVVLEEHPERVEEWCEHLARRAHILQSRGTHSLPNGALVGCYGFAHALYQQALYERLPEARRVRLHRRIGEAEETYYGEQAEEHAAELATHFERGQDSARAVHYLIHAGQNAVRKHAPREAISLFTRSLALLETLPDTPERSQQELSLHLGLGPALVAARGYADPRVEQMFMRALALAHHLGKNGSLLPALAGLFSFYLSRAEFTKARGLGEQVFQLASGSADPLALSAARCMLGIVLGYTGEFSSSDQHFRQFFSNRTALPTESHVLLYGQDLSVTGLSYASRTLWLLGYVDQARQKADEGIGMKR
jgi:DNA-binding winged helix-turn-helix (wHTH) protein